MTGRDAESDRRMRKRVVTGSVGKTFGQGLEPAWVHATIIGHAPCFMHNASPVISSDGVQRIYIRYVFGLNFLRLASLLTFHFPFPTRTGSFFANSYLPASLSILIVMFAKFIVVFLALSAFANAAPGMRTSKLVSCILDALAHPFLASGRGVSVDLREPAGPPVVDSHETDLQPLPITNYLQKVHNRMPLSAPRPLPPRPLPPLPPRPLPPLPKPPRF